MGTALPIIACRYLCGRSKARCGVGLHAVPYSFPWRHVEQSRMPGVCPSSRRRMEFMWPRSAYFSLSTLDASYIRKTKSSGSSMNNDHVAFYLLKTFVSNGLLRIYKVNIFWNHFKQGWRLLETFISSTIYDEL